MFLQQSAVAHAAGGGGGGDGCRDGCGNDLPQAGPECRVEFHSVFLCWLCLLCSLVGYAVVFVGGLMPLCSLVGLCLCVSY